MFRRLIRLPLAARPAKTLFRRFSSEKPSISTPPNTTLTQPPGKGKDSKWEVMRKSFQIRMSAYRVAGLSIGAGIIIVSLPILLWPAVDLYILPSLVERGMKVKKFSDRNSSQLDATEAEEELRKFFRESPGRIVVLTGEQASQLARCLARDTPLCGFYDYRRFFDSNPLEVFAIAHLNSWLGTSPTLVHPDPRG